MGRVKVERPGAGDLFHALVPLQASYVESGTAYDYPSTDIDMRNYIDAGYSEFYISATAGTSQAGADIDRTWHKAVWDGSAFAISTEQEFTGSGRPSLTGNGYRLTLSFRYQGARGFMVFGVSS